VAGYFRECLRHFLLRVALVFHPYNLTQRGS
jgi:hypothetical protein